jgi:hypothetical protein
MELVKQANEILKKILVENEEKDLLFEESFKDLDDEVILQIVQYWYLFRTPVAFYSDSGLDLEEYIERKIDDTI